MRKLKLNRETLRELKEAPLQEVKGGILTLVVQAACPLIFGALSKVKDVNCNLT